LENFRHEANALVFDFDTLLRLPCHDCDKEALQRHTDDENTQTDQGRVSKLISVQTGDHGDFFQTDLSYQETKAEKELAEMDASERRRDRTSDVHTCIGATQRLSTTLRKLWQRKKDVLTYYGPNDANISIFVASVEIMVIIFPTPCSFRDFPESRTDFRNIAPTSCGCLSSNVS